MIEFFIGLAIYLVLATLVSRLVVTIYVNRGCYCGVDLENRGTHNTSCAVDNDRYIVACLAFVLWPLAVFYPLILFIGRSTTKEKVLFTRAKLKETEREVKRLQKEYNL